MRLKSIAVGATAVMAAGLGIAAPASAAETAGTTAVGVAAVSCNGTTVIWKTSSTYIRLPVSSGGSITCEMGRGAQGSHVSALQRALRNCYSRSIAIDGIFGPATESALKYAQSQAGTAADGIYGPNTRDAIKWPRFNTSGSFTGYCAKR